MAYLKFINSSKIYKCTVIPQDSIVTLKFDSDMVVSTAGFDLYLDEKCQIDIGVGIYHVFTTVYRNDKTTAKYNGYQLSNDGSIYREPDPIPEEPPYEPTLEDLKASKIEEMKSTEQKILSNGIDVDISTGTEHFPLGDKDMLYLLGLQSMVASGQENIPWHNGDESEPCKFYSNSDMAKIQETAMSFVVYHETRLRDLTRFINSLTDKDSVKSITYNTTIPSEFHSEVMEALQSEV